MEVVCLVGGRRTTQLMRDPLGGKLGDTMLQEASRTVASPMIAIGLVCALSCAHSRTFDYTSDDPVAKAVCALADSGDYRVLAIKSRDSLIIPIDWTLPDTAVNLEMPPGGFYIFLKPEGLAGRRDRPSEQQQAFMQRYNTVIFQVLQSLPHEESLPPNLRLKLTGCGGRLKGNSLP
jgi:hypothetical protein